jgi:lipoprotein-anchoring transpeptidase ErfK/SrfK
LKSIISSNWLRCSGTLLASAALTLITLNVWAAPTLSTPDHESIAKKIMARQASKERWIQVDLKSQRLIAWEGANPVYAIVISTGKASTPTRPGIFKIQTKVPKQRMSGADYDLPNVPYVMFYQGNYAIHGAYWHYQFGTPVSHGCVNVAVNHASWLFDWASVGTQVVINQ